MVKIQNLKWLTGGAIIFAVYFGVWFVGVRATALFVSKTPPEFTGAAHSTRNAPGAKEGKQNALERPFDTPSVEAVAPARVIPRVLSEAENGNARNRLPAESGASELDTGGEEKMRAERVKFGQYAARLIDDAAIAGVWTEADMISLMGLHDQVEDDQVFATIVRLRDLFASGGLEYETQLPARASVHLSP